MFKSTLLLMKLLKVSFFFKLNQGLCSRSYWMRMSYSTGVKMMTTSSAKWSFALLTTYVDLCRHALAVWRQRPEGCFNPVWSVPLARRCLAMVGISELHLFMEHSQPILDACADFSSFEEAKREWLDLKMIVHHPYKHLEHLFMPRITFNYWNNCYNNLNYWRKTAIL